MYRYLKWGAAKRFRARSRAQKCLFSAVLGGVSNAGAICENIFTAVFYLSANVQAVYKAGVPRWQ